MVIWISAALILYIMASSLYTYFKRKEQIRGRFSFDQFYILVIIYLTVMIGFGLFYFLLSQKGIPLLNEGYLQGTSQLDRLGHAIYFSGVTLMTIGYGDITPIGIGKFIALLEAMLGYVLPAAFFVRVLRDSQYEENNIKHLNNLPNSDTLKEKKRWRDGIDN
ncbi:potassium channel family protein [Salinibacillus xinjiangensis]|uniref:Two pore domain potassium channel family protein n=1 Tax=Salinibacillus xinjiangensis TaxID=1229268 RepID=A0A6G1X9T5_9BACI|nr:potassium channel family protein [Salinibacillus xinjiangensis]MRG87548.1 two pore domain potassium channel family protein [Salinibacillus xinjiangensis]